MVRIDPEFAALCPPLSDEEHRDLEKDILIHGCREPGVIWKEHGILLDGHHRREICLANNLAFKHIHYSFPSREAVKAWMITNALARRHLSREKASELRGKLYISARKDPKDTLKQNSAPRESGEPSVAARAEPKANGAPALVFGEQVAAPDAPLRQTGEAVTPAAPEPDQSNVVAVESTAEQVAKQTGVSARTILRDAEYALCLDLVEKLLGSDVRKAITSREVKLTQAEVRTLAKSGADAAAVFDRLKSKRCRKKGGTKSESAPSTATPFDCDKLARAAERLCHAVGSYRKAGVRAADRAQLESLWKLRALVDVLGEEMNAMN